MAPEVEKTCRSFQGVHYLEKYDELSESEAFSQKLRCFTEQNRPKGRPLEHEFYYFQILKWMLQTFRAKKVDEKNGVICLVSLFPSWYVVLKLSKKVSLSSGQSLLTLIWVGFSGVHSEVWGMGVLPPLPHPCLKLVRIMLETWNLVRKYIHICSFRKYTKALLSLLMSAFFGKNSIFTQSNSVRAVLKIF